MAAFAAEWLPGYHASHRIGLRTMETYGSTLKTYIVPRLGVKTMDAVTPALVREWFADLETTGKSYHVQAGIRTCLSAMFRSAEESGVIASNPARGLRLPRKPQTSRTIPGPAEYERLLVAMPEQWKLLTETLWSTGLRWGEALALRASDIDGETIRVRRTMLELRSPQRFEERLGTKTGAGRDIRIGTDLADRLRAAGNGGGPIFTTRNGSPPLRSPMSVVWKRALEQAGLPPSRVHDLRHAHASLLANDSSVPLALVRDRLGHRSLETTNSYLHPVTDAQDVAVTALERAMGR
ncbi:MAG: tyrosine-type recombinase/integrase, partial [Streptosporangiaceae bacterium]